MISSVRTIEKNKLSARKTILISNSIVHQHIRLLFVLSRWHSIQHSPPSKHLKKFTIICFFVEKLGGGRGDFIIGNHTNGYGQ